MEKTLSDITANLGTEVEELLDSVLSEAVDNVPDDAAEEYADDQGYGEPDEEDEESEAVANDRNLILMAYNAGRDAAFDAVREAANDAKG